MDEKRRKWGWRRKRLTWGAVVIVVVASLFCGLRTCWITPVPGVSVEMTRPHVTEADLGPESAYRLLLAALAEIAKAEAVDADENVRTSFEGVLAKLGISVTRPETAGGTAQEPAFPSFPEPEEAMWGGQEPVRVWQCNWWDARAKLARHPWPTSPPPPAPLPLPRREPSSADLFTEREPDAHDLAIATEAPWTLEQYEDIRHGIALVRPALPLLDRALVAPNPQMPTVESFVDAKPRVTWALQLCQWLSISAYIHETEGDMPAAFQDIERVLRTGALLTRGGYWSDYMANLRCSSLAMMTARTIAMRHSIPPETLRQAAESFLRVADEAEPYIELVRADFVPLRNLVPEYYRHSVLDINTAINEPHAPMRPGKRLVNGLAFSAAPLAGSTPARTLRNIDWLCQHLVVLAEKPYSAAVQDEYDALLREWCPRRRVATQVLGTWDPLGYHLAGWMHVADDWMHARITAYPAQLRAMALFLAVRAYEVDHRHLPDRLDELAPAYISRLPEDPFSGKPFGYLRSGVPGLPPEAWSIYSVGGNCVDDGGTAYHPYSDSPFASPDLVTPSQDYPAPWRESKPRREWYPKGRKWSRVGPPQSCL